LERYIEKNGKKLKYGYTTGSCATAASKASVYMLVNKKIIDKISIDTPKGWTLTLDVYDQVIKENYAVSSIVKDGGDDPDMTNGMKIYSKISFRDDNKINIYGGYGIGTVTREGLSVKVGKSAINPVPLKTIELEVRKIIGENIGVDIEIYAPRGVEIAKKTFNPKLGIVGGISIIGTSGIVEPMSEDALIETLRIEMRIFSKKNLNKPLMISLGNYGRDFAKDILKLDIGEIIKCSNYISEVVDEATRLGISEILWIAHIGKMIKVSGGIFNTHSKVADARMEILMANLALLSSDINLIKKVSKSITTDEAIKYIKEYNKMEVFNNIVKKTENRLNIRSYGEVKNGVVIFSNEHGLLGVTDFAKKLMEEFKLE